MSLVFSLLPAGLPRRSDGREDPQPSHADSGLGRSRPPLGLGENVTIETAGGTRIVAGLIVETPEKVQVVVEVKNGASAGFTANQIITGLAEGGSISGVARGTGRAASTLSVEETLGSVASFVIRYIH